MMRKSLPFLAMVLVVAFAIPAFGQLSAIDYFGYAWETGELPRPIPPRRAPSWTAPFLLEVGFFINESRSVIIDIL